MKNKAERIKIVSGERVRDELNKMLLSQKPSNAFRMLDDIGILEIILPELKKTQGVCQPVRYHDKDVFGHTMDVTDKIVPDLVLRVAALLHDIGKPDTISENNGKISFIGHELKSAQKAKRVLTRLKYPADFIKRVCFIIENHMYPKNYSPQWKDSSVRKFADKMAQNLENIELFAIADGKAHNGELFDRVRKLKKQNMLLPEREMFDGNELAALFERPAGKWIGEAKSYIKRLQFENPKLTKEEAVKKLKNMLKIQRI